MKKIEKFSKMNLVATFNVAMAKAIFCLKQTKMIPNKAPNPNIP